jgi:hypothetical protein
MSLITLPKRHPVVPDRALPFTERDALIQIQRGLYTVDRGERFALPIDHVKRPHDFKGRKLWDRDRQGRVFRVGVRFQPHGSTVQRRVLEFARDRIHPEIPYWYYLLTLGHDLHVSNYGNLFARHWHNGWANPFTGESAPALDPSFATLFATHYVEHECDLPGGCPKELGITLDMLKGLRGFTEDLGWLSGAKVTDAFVSEEIDELVSTTGTEYADFDFHEVGTSSTAENNNHTALQTSTGIARATGTPTDADPIYRTVATITADTSETWQEHGVFNNSSGAAMMDRNLTGGQAVVSSDQVQYTYELTKAPEA